MMAIIPTFVLLGPGALLAALFPAVFAGLALVMRRWLVLLGVASMSSLAYFLYWWFAGSLRRAGVDDPRLLWGAMAGMALAGAGWSWYRHRRLGATKMDKQRPNRAAAVVLTVLSLLGTAMTFWAEQSAPGNESAPASREWLLITSVCIVGAAHIWWQRMARLRIILPTETMMLLVLAAGSVALMIAPTPARQGESAVRVLWAFEPVGRGAMISTPAVSGVDGDGRVYAAIIHDAPSLGSGAVYALEEETGRMRWKFDDGGAMLHMYSSPCVGDGRLYVGEGMHANFACKLYCLDAATGRKLWDFPTTSHIESSPCLVRERVVFGAGDDGIYGVEARTGKRVWQFQDGIHVDDSPVVAGSRVYVGSGVSRRYRKFEVVCLNAESGKVRWRAPMDLPVNSVAYADGRVLVSLGNGRLLTGAPLPERPAGALVCLDAETGNIEWRYEVQDAVLGRAAAAEDGTSYFGSRTGSVTCLSAHGERRWEKMLGQPIVTNPALAEGHLYVVGAEGKIWRLRARTGDVGWMLDLAAYSQTKPRLLSSPIVRTLGGGADGHHRIYLGAELRNPVSSAAMVFCLED